MFIQELTLENVRYFEKAVFEFKPGFNLLVGENGFGKTTVLRSILATVGSQRHSGRRFFGFQTRDIQLGADDLGVSAVIFDRQNEGRECYYSKSVEGEYRRKGNRQDIVTLYYQSNEALSSGLRERKAREIETPESGKTSDVEELLHEIEQAPEADTPPQVRNGRAAEIRKFISKVLSGMSDRFKEFTWRFEAYDCDISDSLGGKQSKDVLRAQKILSDLILRDLRRNPISLTPFSQKVLKISSRGLVLSTNPPHQVCKPFVEYLRTSIGLKDVELINSAPRWIAHVKLSPRIVIQTSSGDLTLDQLSDGEQRLFTLFADIARALSSSSPLPLCELEAIVLIDEIDVHLHPKWQRAVAPALEGLFPNCQFIATTHSPFVIQSVSLEKVQEVTKSGGRAFFDHVRTIDDIAEEIQGIEMPQRSKRAEELSETAERYFSLLRQENASSNALQTAEAAYRKASEPFASNPALDALLRVEQAQFSEQ
jgi:predicted ATP-binding protein involved in virulence